MKQWNLWNVQPRTGYVSYSKLSHIQETKDIKSPKLIYEA